MHVVACENTPTNVRFKTLLLMCASRQEHSRCRWPGMVMGVLSLGETETPVRCCIIDK